MELNLSNDCQKIIMHCGQMDIDRLVNLINGNLKPPFIFPDARSTISTREQTDNTWIIKIPIESSAGKGFAQLITALLIEELK